MVDNKSKFELMAMDKAQVVSAVNESGAEITTYKNSLPYTVGYTVGAFLYKLIGKNGTKDVTILEEGMKLGLDSHEGRKDFLSKKLGIDGNTTDNYRFVTYTNDSGQVMYFRSHMDGDKKLVLTDSIAAPETADQVHQFFQSFFKPLPKPIEVQIEKSNVTKDGTKLDLSPDERKKLETQTTLAAAIQKSGDVQLTSNLRLPGKPQTTGPALNA